MADQSKFIEYPVEDIEVIELSDATSTYINDFECDVEELKKFLVEDSLNQTIQSVNKTFLWISRKQKKLIAYITICADAISLDAIRKEEMQRVGIKYKSLPALKICRMAVRREYTKQGLGKRMVSFAITRALRINEEAACRFITLDAKNDEKIPDNLKPLRFYKKLGFEELKRRPKDNTIHLFRDLIEFIKPRFKP